VRRRPPSLVGKAATAFQFALILAIMAAPGTVSWLFVPTAALSLGAEVESL
jgi:hypothetical protein